MTDYSVFILILYRIKPFNCEEISFSKASVLRAKCDEGKVIMHLFAFIIKHVRTFSYYYYYYLSNRIIEIIRRFRLN